MVNHWILVGSFAKFISVLRLDTDAATLDFVSQTQVGASPSWLSSSPFSSTLFTIDDVWQYQSPLSSLGFDPATGGITLQDSVSSQAISATHVTTLRNGTKVAVAHYSGSSVFFTDVEDASFVGTGQKVAFSGRGPRPNQDAAHPHQVLEWDEEVLVPDLGSDKTWRLGLNSATNQYNVLGSFAYSAGTGPRHAVVVCSNLYTVSENMNLVTHHSMSHDVIQSSFPTANASIVPPDTPNPSGLAAAELVYNDGYLYASNRKDAHPDGDAITILSTHPLQAIAHVRTGLREIRGMSFIGEDYLVVGGLQGGGIKVYRKVAAEDGYLELVVHLDDSRVQQPTSFVSYIA